MLERTTEGVTKWTTALPPLSREGKEGKLGREGMYY